MKAFRVVIRACVVAWFVNAFGWRYLFAAPWSRTGTRATLKGRMLAELFESLGGAYTKIGQVLGSRPDLLGAQITEPLSRLQDRVRAFRFELVTELIQQEFNKPLDDVFQTFDRVPCSSASVAQVHRATLPSGAEVAVKLRRPGIVQAVETDLILWNGLASVIGRLPGMRMIPVTQLFGEIGALVQAQLDFRQEAANHLTFLKNFSDNSEVRVPKLYLAWCTEAVITMEYFDALVKVSELTPESLPSKSAVLMSLRALYKMVFVDGLTHADMHPGNVFYRPDGKFVLLDFGMVARLNGEELVDFAFFFFGMVTNNGQECARVIEKTASHRRPGFRYDEFERAVSKVIARHAAKRASEFEVARFAFDIFDVQRRYGIRGSTAFTATILSFVVFEGILKRVDPHLDFQSEARRFLPTILGRLIAKPKPAAAVAVTA
ncbi:MAG TPA: AarF/UbiB family protein [Bryobacteraceae bacterium]|jgi:ubiquinone biosynthesis protein|nr:AarF/UbiB family protein [Bryobacteraceae bacterium]